jgi:hypothetical protein
MFRLPVSGLSVALRQPAGSEDLLLRENTGPEIALALELITRVAWPTDGQAIDANALTITDFEVLLLRLHQIVFGDTIRAETRCAGSECEARVDIWFSAETYLAHHSPLTPKGIRVAEKPSWFQVEGKQAAFRLPTVADLSAVQGTRHADRECFSRCVEPLQVSGKLRNRIESVMSAMAPSLSHDVRGLCPECHRSMNVYFDVLVYVLRELRDQAASIYRDVHLLAFHYNWPEESILGLPRKRRLRYAQMLMQEEALA